jgi:hypothetical protein
MGRALEASFVALMVIIVAFVVVPWVFTRSKRARDKYGDKVTKGANVKDIRDARKQDDLDGPDGPHGRPTV